jgi:hypothetical protein
MSLLNSTLQTLVVRLRDMSGNVTQQKLHNRVFDAYEAKSLVFEAITPEQQAAMQQFRGVVPPQHPAGQPTLLENWQELVQIHSDRNIYQLLPRRAKTNASYSVMRAICQSPGSPFTMEHRLDPIDFKFVFRQTDMDIRNGYNTKAADKVGPSIWFDGLLSTPTDAGLIMCYGVLSTAQISQTAGASNFMKEWCLKAADGDRHRQTKELYKKLLANRVHVFCGTNAVPGRELLNFAKSKGVFVYAKKGAHYVFHA